MVTQNYKANLVTKRRAHGIVFKFHRYKRVFEKFRFSDGLVWKVDLVVEIKLRFLKIRRFYDYFAEMQNRSLVSEREFTRLVGRWVVNFCLYFRWPMHNLTWRREKWRRMVRQMWNIVK